MFLASLGVAKEAFNILVDLEMLVRHETGYESKSIQYRTPTDVANQSIKNYHGQSLDLAKQSLNIDPVESRDFSTITMAIDPDQLNEAKEMIRKFKREFADCVEQSTGDEVELGRQAELVPPVLKNQSVPNHVVQPVQH